MKSSRDGMGSGHRGNTGTALKMVGCEVVMATEKLLNSAHHFLFFSLFLLPPAKRQTREEEFRWAEQ